MAAGVVDHISWVQKVEPDCKPSKPSPFCIFLHSMVLSLKGFISFPTRNRVCRDLSLYGTFLIQTTTGFPQFLTSLLSLVVLWPCPSKLLLSVHPPLLCTCALDQIPVPVLHGFPYLMVLPGLLTVLLMSSQGAFREEFTSLLAGKNLHRHSKYPYHKVPQLIADIIQGSYNSE